MTTEQQKVAATVLREAHSHILSRAEWWQTNPTDPHGINTAVHVAMIEVANAINSAHAAFALELVPQPEADPVPRVVSAKYGELKLSGCEDHLDKNGLTCCKIRQSDFRPLTTAQVWEVLVELSKPDK